MKTIIILFALSGIGAVPNATEMDSMDACKAHLSTLGIEAFQIGKSPKLGKNNESLTIGIFDRYYCMPVQVSE